MATQKKFTALITGLPEKRPPVLSELLCERTGVENPELPALLGEGLSEDSAKALKTEFEMFGVPVELLEFTNGEPSSTALESLSLELDREIEQLRSEAAPKPQPPPELPPVSLSFEQPTGSSSGAKELNRPSELELSSLSFELSEPPPSPVLEELDPPELSLTLRPVLVEEGVEEVLPAPVVEDAGSENLDSVSTDGGGATPFAANSRIEIPDEIEFPDEEDEEEDNSEGGFPKIWLYVGGIALVLVGVFFLTRPNAPAKKLDSPKVDIVQALLNEQDRLLKEDKLKQLEAGKKQHEAYTEERVFSVKIHSLSGQIKVSSTASGKSYLTELRLSENEVPKLTPLDLAAGKTLRPWIKRVELTKRRELGDGQLFSFDSFVYLEDNQGSERLRVKTELSCESTLSKCHLILGEAKPGQDWFEVERLKDSKLRVLIAGGLEINPI